MQIGTINIEIHFLKARELQTFSKKETVSFSWGNTDPPLFQQSYEESLALPCIHQQMPHCWPRKSLFLALYQPHNPLTLSLALTDQDTTLPQGVETHNRSLLQQQSPCNLKTIITLSVLRQVHHFFQSEFSRQRDLECPISAS